MKSRMLLSPLWKIVSWRKLILCGKKCLEKPTVELPHEIIEWNILPRLPAKSLCRFMCVCKQWKSHISTCDQFTRENLEHINKGSLTHRKVLEIDYISQSFRTCDFDDFKNDHSNIMRSIPFVNEAQEVLPLAHHSNIIRSIPFVNKAQVVLPLASLDGLIFVTLHIKNSCYAYAFWNPLTGAYERLSNSPKFYSPFHAFGLYFDSNDKDYKVIHICFGGAFKALIYSQRLNSTKEIHWLENHQRLSSSFWSTPISFGESLYFIGKSNLVKKFWIIVFDVKSEKIREIRFPLLNQENPYYANLMVIKGCIHIFVARCMTVGGELWKMDGDGDGWTKVKDFPPSGHHPLTYDHEKLDIQDLSLFNYGKRRKEIVYLETLVSPSW